MALTSCAGWAKVAACSLLPAALLAVVGLVDHLVFLYRFRRA